MTAASRPRASLASPTTPLPAPRQVNIYRGSTFGSLFADYERVSDKPLLIGEYGVDAYNSDIAAEDEEVR